MAPRCNKTKPGAMVERSAVFVLGPPCAGKGTQCRKIANAYDLVHISAGELLRKEQQTPNSPHGRLVESYIKQGKIVPSHITCKLLEKTIIDSDKLRFLIDGFPRNLENRQGWDEVLAEKVRLMFVLYLDCSLDVCVQRCIGRATGNDATRRYDDTIDILEKRIQTHLNETEQTIEYYKKKGLVRVVDGSAAEEEVFQQIQTILQDYGIK